MSEHLDIITTFLSLSQNLVVDNAAYARVLHPQIEQIEFPNLIHKTTQHRSFEDILDNLRAARELLHDPYFTTQRILACADGSVLVESHWEATITNDIGPLLRGQRIASQICAIYELEDNKIIQHRQYICYDKF